MKRIAGTFTLLLAGLSGCLSFTGQPGQDGKKPTAEAKQTPATAGPALTGPVLPPAKATAAANPNVPAPASPQWTMPPEHVTAKQALPPAVNTAATPRALTPPSNLAPLPGVPRINTPAGKEVQQAGLPSATTKGEPEVIRPAAYNVPQHETTNHAATVISGKQPEVIPPMARTVPVPPPPAAKAPAEAKPAPTTMATGKAGVPIMRLVNTKRITLNFEVKDVGPSGLSSVELWYTQPGQEWKKYDAPTQASAYVVEVDEEGMYGFTLLARSGTGMGKEPPQAGEQPQVWVIVDLSKPDVLLGDVVPSMKGGAQHVAVKWKAGDKNLGRNSITLSYAEKQEGPWKVIAAGLENTGVYNWEVPKGTPAKVLFRVEACDLAGNVGSAQSAKAILMDNSTPTVSIVNVEANSGR